VAAAHRPMVVAAVRGPLVVPLVVAAVHRSTGAAAAEARGCLPSGRRQLRRPLPLRLRLQRRGPCADRISAHPARRETGRSEPLGGSGASEPPGPATSRTARACPSRPRGRPSLPRRRGGAPRGPGRAGASPPPSWLPGRASSARAWTWRRGRAEPVPQVHRWPGWPDLPPPLRVKPETKGKMRKAAAEWRRQPRPACVSPSARSAGASARHGRRAAGPSPPHEGASSPRAHASCLAWGSRESWELRKSRARPVADRRAAGHWTQEARARRQGVVEAGR
jgi:hypothetical protein